MEDLSGRMLGEFVLREPIAEGGYAVVYRAEQPVLKRDVVVKVLRARRQRNDATLDRFLREARLASQLDHPFAAHVYAFGTDDDGLLWIAMELVHGVTLGAWLDRHGPMSLDQFVPLFERVAEVVHVAHERGIVHRDLKPSNVMVIERGGRLLPKLLDFGIAKVENERASALPEPCAPLGDNEDGAATAQIRPPQSAHRTATDPDHGHKLTRPGVRMGSAPYMPPEQWDDAGAVSPATDIYSLGILAYEALTGKRPFRADTTKDYYWRHLRAEIPPLGAGFSPALDGILRRATAKNPAARHGSVLELAADLRALLQAQPREQIRSLAQVWDARARSPALLLQSRDLLRERTGVVGDLERTFMTTSQRHASRRAHLRRVLAMSAGVLAMSAVWYRGKLETEMAERVAEASITQSELEQGRSALLHGEPGAATHLAKAHRRDPRPTTAFMLARALQPRLAEQARLQSSFGRMWSASFSPDGKQLVTTDDKNAQIWDAQSHRPLFTLPHGDTVYQAVYSADATRLLTACGDGAVRIWDPIHGQLVRELREKNRVLRYYAVTPSPDGRLIAAVDIDGAVARVWDAGTGVPLAELHQDASGFASVGFSDDGRWLATSGGGDVRVFDTRTWGQTLVLPGSRLHWDPRGPRLLTGGSRGDVSLWAIPHGTRVHHLRELGESIDALAFSLDGRLIAAASHDGTEQVWDAASGELKSQGNHLHNSIRSIEFDASSTLLAAGGASGAIAVTDAAGEMPVSILDGARSVITAAHFIPSTHHVVGVSWDGTARIWDATSPYRRWNSPPAPNDHQGCGLATSLEPDRRFVAVGCGDHATRIWDTTRGQLIAELPSVTSSGNEFGSAYPAVSAAGDRAAIARGNTVELYELPSGNLLRTIAHGATVNAVAFASLGNDFVSGAVDGSLLVTRDGGAQLELPRSAGGIDAAGFLADGRLVAADAQRRLRIYDANGKTIADLELAARVLVLRSSPDSRHVITLPRFAGKVAPPELWDVEHHRAITTLDDLGQGRVFSARFVAGDRIVTACGDGKTRLWDGATGTLRQRFTGGSRFMADATLSPDGSLVVGGDGDGVLRFWDAVSGRPVWTMAAHRSFAIGIRMEGSDIVTRGFSGDIARWTLPGADLVIEACSHNESCAREFP